MRDAYGLKFRNQRTMQQTFMYRAAADGEVDVISAYTSDGQIAKYDLVVLDDPKHAVPPYDAILLLSPKRANDQKLIAAVTPLIDSIPVAIMREANARASNGDTTPDAVARWLWEQVGKK
jgi:osmoprotectant transport system permease protein